MPRVIDGMMTPLFRVTVLPNGTPETEAAKNRMSRASDMLWIFFPDLSTTNEICNVFGFNHVNVFIG